MTVPNITSQVFEKGDVNNGTLTIDPVPSDIADDDILIITQMSDGDTGAITWPSGFAEIGKFLAPSSLATVAAAYKVASSESGTYVVSWVNGQDTILWMGSIRNATTSTPIDDPNTSNTGNSTSVTSSGFTVAGQDEIIFSVHTSDNNGMTEDGTGFETGWTGHIVKQTAAGGHVSGALQTKNFRGVGETGDCTYTADVTRNWVAMQFAIKPDAVTALPTIIHKSINPSLVI